MERWDDGGSGDVDSWNCLAEAPSADGLYDPTWEKEACGVGFVVHIDGIRSNKVSTWFFGIRCQHPNGPSSVYCTSHTTRENQ